jgi:hypothetical protein
MMSIVPQVISCLSRVFWDWIISWARTVLTGESPIYYAYRKAGLTEGDDLLVRKRGDGKLILAYKKQSTSIAVCGRLINPFKKALSLIREKVPRLKNTTVQSHRLFTGQTTAAIIH